MISSGATAVLVFCGFVTGSVIINVISWTRTIKTLYTMAQYTHSLKKDFVRQRITSHAKRCMCSWV